MDCANPYIAPNIYIYIYIEREREKVTVDVLRKYASLAINIKK